MATLSPTASCFAIILAATQELSRAFFFECCPVCRLYGHQVAWSRRRAATRFKTASATPEVTRWVPTSGAPSRSWDMRELTVHAAMNASSPPGGPQGGAPETLLRASRARPLYSGKRLVFHAGPFLSCHGLPWGRISMGSRYSRRVKRQRVRGPGGWLGACVCPRWRRAVQGAGSPL